MGHILADLSQFTTRCDWLLPSTSSGLPWYLNRGQSLYVSGSSPIFQVLRTVHNLAASAALQSAEPSNHLCRTHHGYLANHYQHGCGCPASSGYQRCQRLPAIVRSTSLDCAAVPYIFTGLKIGIGLAAAHLWQALIGGVGIGFFIRTLGTADQ